MYNTKKAKIQATISQLVKELGAMYLSGIHQTYWNTKGASDSLQVGLNGAIGRVNYNVSYNYTRESRDVNRHQSAEQSVFLSLSFPISIGGDQQAIYANYNTGLGNHGNPITHQAGLSGTLLERGNLNWSISQSYGRDQSNSRHLSASYSGGYGNSSLGYSYSDSYRQLNYGITGGVILHRDGITFGQPMGETSILVAALGLSHVAIENETGVKTDWRGYGIKPYASVYRENRVALDLSSLGDGMDVDETVTRVIPTKGAIARASFQGHNGSRLLLKLNYNDRPVPFGAMVTIGTRSSIVGDDGIAYLTGMPNKGWVNVKWGEVSNQTCSGAYILPANDEKQPLQYLTVSCK
ncbi:fimbria/pilus outer membrane usher protein [Providencia rettgeri]|nr:fimbria/pilus outer membrane usher protein [Providencia rettgeri]